MQTNPHLKNHRDLAIEALEAAKADPVEVAKVHATLALAESITRSFPPFPAQLVAHDSLTEEQVERIREMLG